MGSANVARFLEERAVDSPERAAVLAPQGRSSDGTIKYERLSFAQLNGETEQLAAVFRETGISRGTRVLLMVKPGSDLIRCCFTLFKVGAVPVVIDPGMGVRSFLQCVRRSKPEAVVGIPLAIILSRLFGSSFRQTRTRLTVGKGLMRKAAAFPEKGEGSVESTADELAAILFTSGSTGPAKGVCYQHEQFDAQVQLVRESFGIEAGEVDLPMLPLFALFNPALGMTTVVPELNPGKPATVQPEKILQALDQCAVTNSFGSPVLWQKLSAHAAAKGISFPGVRRILMAGAPVAPVLYRQMRPVFPEAQLISPYGATECLPVSAIEGGMVLNETAAQTEAGAGTCVGFPVSGVAVRIIRIADEGKAPGRSDLEEPLPAGEIGEIVATGPSVTKSYDQLPEATKASKIEDASGRTWHRMGDAGWLDERGRLWFCGRLAERVHLSDGSVLYTDPFEGVFNAVPGVKRSALVGIGKERAEPVVVIERLDSEAGRKLTEEDLLRAAQGHSLTKALTQFAFDPAFPVDVRHNAKINRRLLGARVGKRLGKEA